MYHAKILNIYTPNNLFYIIMAEEIIENFTRK